MESSVKYPPKRRRKSRFAPSAATPKPATAAPPPPNATAVPDSPPPPAPAELPTTFENASVAALRARVAASRRTAGADPPPKRRRTRFSQAQPSAPPTLPTPPLHIDVTAIPVAPVSTVRINRNAAQERKVDSVLNVSDADLLDTDPHSNPYYDASIRLPQRPRRTARKDFRFVEQGEIVARAEKTREKAQVEARTAAYRAELAARAVEGEAVPVLPPLAEDLRVDGEEARIPDCEWWDLPFLVRKRDGVTSTSATGSNAPNADVMDTDGIIEVREERITHYIHHPPPITPAVPKKPPPVLPLMLTKKETKRLRRQRRMEAHKEKQEMIAVGLLPPPPPKVKLSNLMRVLANESSADPTKVEAEVRAQVEERRRKHEADNEARKKTKEERREKAHVKTEKDKEDGLHAAVFRIGDLQNPQHRFKVDVNARQLEMTGSLLVFSNCNIVVVEGGAKALRKYKKLMLRRIDWNGAVTAGLIAEKQENQSDMNEETQVKKEGDNQRLNTCVLVWEGPISAAAFKEFQTVSVRTQKECRYHFRKHGVEHYWDLCTQANPTGNENLGVKRIG